MCQRARFCESRKLELEREVERLGAQNEEPPTVCDQCGEFLLAAEGEVGEDVLYCPEHGLKWEDAEQAIGMVL